MEPANNEIGIEGRFCGPVHFAGDGSVSNTAVRPSQPALPSRGTGERNEGADKGGAPDPFPARGNALALERFSSCAAVGFLMLLPALLLLFGLSPLNLLQPAGAAKTVHACRGSHRHGTKNGPPDHHRRTGAPYADSDDDDGDGGEQVQRVKHDHPFNVPASLHADGQLQALAERQHGPPVSSASGISLRKRIFKKSRS